MKEEIIQIKDLVKTYPMGEKEFNAIKGISLSFCKKEFTGLVGPSGSGKTTILNIIGTLDKPTKGNVFLMGRDVAKLTTKEAAYIRRKNIGFIFQTFNLLPVYTVYENVELAILLLNWPDKKRHEAIMQALEWVGLTDFKDKKPTQLSGGESQRVAIARAIVKKPDIVLADEPTANLDAENAYKIMEILKNINNELDTTFIFATHDEKVMKYLSRIITLEDGKIADDRKIKI